MDAEQISGGDRVNHDTYGLGTVREVIGTGDKAQAVVDFDEHGKKTLLLEWAPLEVAGR